MYEMGKTEDSPDAKGLALLVHPKIKDCVTDFKTYIQSEQLEWRIEDISWRDGWNTTPTSTPQRTLCPPQPLMLSNACRPWKS